LATRHQILFASSALAALAMAGAAAAQTAAPNCPPTKPNCQAGQSSSVSVSEIVVTGSRIPVANLTSVQPVTTLSGVDIQQRGITNIADAINQLPITGAGVIPTGAQASFGVGVNYIDLFSLGSQHTLTLISGYRAVTDNPTNIFANTGGSQVDINDLPTLFLDRTEIVPATGAAVYGTDAIAGVVNVIMKRRYVGEEINVQGGWSTYGDAPHYTVEAAIGHNFLNDKLNVAVDFLWDQTSNVLNSDRPWTAQQLAFAPNPNPAAGANGIPSQIVIPNNRFAGVTEWGVPYNFYTGNPLTLPNGQLAQFAPGGSLVAFNPGALYGACFNQIVGCAESGGDALNLGPLTMLQTGVDRKIVNAMATYDFSDHLHFHATFNYADVYAASLDEPNFAAIAFGESPGFNAPVAGLAVQISPQNAYLTPQAQSVLAANGVDANGFYLSRSNSDVAQAPFSQASQTFNVNFELSGDFSVFRHTFNWTADWARGENWSQFNSPNIVYGNAASGGSVPDLYGYALDSIIGPNGQPMCRVTAENPGSTNPYISGCVPFDPFGSPASNAASVKYFTANFGDHSFNRLDDGQINVWTNVFKLPAGDARLSLGFEYHRDAASFTPDLASAEGTGYSIPINGQKGSEVSDEYYVEGTLPILGPGFNFPWGAYKLTLNGAYRHVSNSLAGNNEAWNYGGEFSPIPDITLRGSRSKTFMAPPLTDLFASSTSAYDTGEDPCQTSNIDTGPNPKVRQANCLAAFTALEGGNAAAGAAALAAFNNSLVEVDTIPVTVSGNPNLKNEVGNSWTYGLLLQPRWVPGLTLSGDYIEINISNEIESATVGVLLEQCYDTPNYPSATCADFTRAGAGPNIGQLLSANEGFINAGYAHYAGAEYKLDYYRAINRLPFVHTDNDLGQFDFNVDAVNNRRYVTSVSGLGFDAINTAGAFAGSTSEGMPRWRWMAQLTYKKGPFRFGWTTHYVGVTYFDLTFTDDNQEPLKVHQYYTHDLSLAYDIIPRLTLTLNINNITNAAPPYPVGTYPVGYYDYMGRYYTLGVHAKF